MQKSLALLFFLITFLSGIAQTDSSHYFPSHSRKYFTWGNDSTSILLTSYGQRRDFVMIHLHDDEFTSLEAAKKVLAQTGGVLIELENNGERLIKFKKAGKIIWFDPNRIFTAKGLQQNLHFLNNKVTSSAIASVTRFSVFLLRQVPSSAVVIALHNNADRKYSINSYKVHHNHARDALKLHIDPDNDPDDFFLVTRMRLFASLKKSGFNVVLQNNKTAIDDGSFSIHYGRKNRNYINVEAELNSLDEQIKMLRILTDTLH